MKLINDAKLKIQGILKEKTGILMDKADSGFGGTTTTGEVAKSILRSDSRKYLTCVINSTGIRLTIDKILLHVAFILGVVNSS